MNKKNVNEVCSCPTNLDNHPFYGLKLDENQRTFRDNIWDKDKLIVFCNAKAGTGKTTIATATAELLVQYGRYDGIVYIISPYGEGKQGFLPGSITEKSEVYFEPFYQALIKSNVNLNTAITKNTMIENKKDSSYISCLTHTYLRGTNFENKVIILDEAQNYSFEELKKTLTRFSDNCKVIVIGHDEQCDIISNKSNAFVKYMNYFEKDDRCSVCELTKNYRGWISSYADALEGE